MSSIVDRRADWALSMDSDQDAQADRQREKPARETARRDHIEEVVTGTSLCDPQLSGVSARHAAGCALDRDVIDGLEIVYAGCIEGCIADYIGRYTATSENQLKKRSYP
jgi:hypothetical protein